MLVMINRFTISSLMVLTALTYTPKAFAQSVNIDSTASVPNTCIFGSVVNTQGALRLVTVGNNIFLSSKTSDGGTPANLSIACNGTLNLQISPPTLVNKPAAYPSTTPLGGCTVTITPIGGTFATSSLTNNSCTEPFVTSGSFIADNNGTSGSLQVEMVAGMGSGLLPPGDYTFRTTLTVLP
jgi:hypothetical protein